MQLRAYQEASKRTLANSGDDARDIIISALGLAGEAGEVVEIIKKAHGHGKRLDLPKLADELGDVLWYVTALATMHGLSLETIAARNVDKLLVRYPDGFTPAIAREAAL